MVALKKDELTPEAKTKSQQQGEALDKLLMALDMIDDEPFDEFDKILAQGLNVRDAKL